MLIVLAFIILEMKAKKSLLACVIATASVHNVLRIIPIWHEMS